MDKTIIFKWLTLPGRYQFGFSIFKLHFVLMSLKNCVMIKWVQSFQCYPLHTHYCNTKTPVVRRLELYMLLPPPSFPALSILVSCPIVPWSPSVEPEHLNTCSPGACARALCFRSIKHMDNASLDVPAKYEFGKEGYEYIRIELHLHVCPPRFNFPSSLRSQTTRAKATTKSIPQDLSNPSPGENHNLRKCLTQDHQ